MPNPNDPPPGEPTPDADTDDAESRAMALTGDELAALEAHLPTEPEQEILDYARGAHLALPDLVALTVDAGALAAMVEHQGRTIAALQARLQKLVEAAAAAQERPVAGA